MNESDKDRFALLISGLAEAHRKEASKAMLTAYWLGLKSLSLEQVTTAVTVSLEQSKFMPSPAELRELVGGASIDDRALVCWQQVLEAVGRYGPYKSVDFHDKAINGAIRTLGGWPDFVALLNSSKSEALTRQEFVRAYRSMARTEINGEAAAPLVGLSAGQVVDGQVVPPIPVRIGAPIQGPRLSVVVPERIAN